MPSVASPVNLTCSHATGFVFSCSHPTGYTVIISQPTSNLGPESPEGQSQPIPLPMPMPPPEPQLSTSASPAGEENPGETLPESKWLVRATSSDLCIRPSYIRLVLYEKLFSSLVLPVHACQLPACTWLITAPSLIHNKYPVLSNYHSHAYLLQRSTCMFFFVCFFLSCPYACCCYIKAPYCQKICMAELITVASTFLCCTVTYIVIILCLPLVFDT